MAFGDTIQSPSNAGASGAASVTFTAATAGNLLVFVIARSGPHSAGGAWGSISGWTFLNGTPINSGNVGGGAFWKIAAGGETSVTSAGTGEAGNWSASVIEIEGPFAASPLDQSTEDESNISTAVTSQASGTTGTTAQNDEFALAFFSADNNANVTDGRAYSNSFTEVVFVASGSRAAAFAAKRVLSSTGTYSSTFSTTDTGDEMYGGIATWKKGTSDVTVNLSTVTLAGSVPAGDAIPGAVSLTMATVSLAGSVPVASIQAVTSLIMATLSLAGSIPQGDVLPGAASVLLNALDLLGSAPVLTVQVEGGAQTVTLNTLSLAGSLPQADAQPGGVSISLAALTVQGSVPAASVSSPAPGINVNLSTLSLAGSILAGDVLPGAVSVTLDVLSLAGSVPAASVSSPAPGIYVTLSTLSLVGSVPQADAQPGAVSVALAALILQGSMPAGDIQPGAVSILLLALSLAGSTPQAAVQVSAGAPGTGMFRAQAKGQDVEMVVV